MSVTQKTINFDLCKGRLGLLSMELRVTERLRVKGRNTSGQGHGREPKVILGNIVSSREPTFVVYGGHRLNLSFSQMTLLYSFQSLSHRYVSTSQSEPVVLDRKEGISTGEKRNRPNSKTSNVGLPVNDAARRCVGGG